MPTTTLPRVQPSGAGVLQRTGLSVRIALALAVVAAEKVSLGLLVDRPAQESLQGPAQSLVAVQHWASGTAVAFVLLLAALLYGARDARWRDADHGVRGQPLQRQWLLVHASCLLVLALLTPWLFATGAHWLFALLRASLWAAAAAGAGLSALVAIAPWSQLRAGLLAVRPYAVTAAVAAAVGAAVMSSSQRLWAPAASLTFELVHAVLSPWIGSLHADPATRILSTDRFSVRVSEACSGLEGVGMMLALCVAWLLVFRREYRLQRAWVLLPAGVVLVFAVNVLRIAALVVIGHTGHPQMAVSGFHSQAGWIAFNALSLGMLYLSRRSPWMNLQARAAHGSREVTENPVAACLLPLLSILAVGMLTAAVSTGFDTFYGLRWFVAAWVLWRCWPRLASIDWRCSWRGPLVGVAVFVLWLWAGRSQLAPTDMPAELAAMSPLARSLWMALRALAAVTTVPLAEELAYRGFLMRRLATPDFDSASLRDVGVPALMISAAVFGIAHGAMWLPGCVAGLAYGFVAVRTGRLGEAVAAHATTNALLAALVLGGGQWQYW